MCARRKVYTATERPNGDTLRRGRSGRSRLEERKGGRGTKPATGWGGVPERRKVNLNGLSSDPVSSRTLLSPHTDGWQRRTCDRYPPSEEEKTFGVKTNPDAHQGRREKGQDTTKDRKLLEESGGGVVWNYWAGKWSRNLNGQTKIRSGQWRKARHVQVAKYSGSEMPHWHSPKAEKRY